MKTRKIINITLDVLLLFGLLILLSSLGLRDNMSTGWTFQQITGFDTLINKLTYIDSLTGFAVTGPDLADNCYILRTSNAGENWNIVHTYPPPNGNRGFTQIKFANDRVGYASTDYFNFFKTTNKGINWFAVSYPPLGAEDIAVLNPDTVLAVKSGGFGGGVYRSTNGGSSWQYIWTNGSASNPSKIYMINSNIGFHCEGGFDPEPYSFRKTTDGGLHWIHINDSTYLDIKFSDTLTGYKIMGSTNLKKSTNGGLNWIKQYPPNFFGIGGSSLSLINKDTVWFSGPVAKYNSHYYGVLCKTTNGGLNWGYQIPDTSRYISDLFYVQFVNKINGWASQIQFNASGFHTTTGGNDTTFYTDVNSNISVFPKDFELFQNYPNPFNQSTIINVHCSIKSNIQIKVYDITGKEIATLLNEEKPAGSYSIRFDSGNLSSGIYFYKMDNYDRKTNQVNSDTKKMIILR